MERVEWGARHFHQGAEKVFIHRRGLAQVQGGFRLLLRPGSARPVVAGVLAGGLLVALFSGAIFVLGTKSQPKATTGMAGTASLPPGYWSGIPDTSGVTATVIAPIDPNAASSVLFAGPGGGEYTLSGGTYTYADQGGGKDKEAPVVERAEAQRKIKHTAEVSVIVEDFDPVADRVAELAVTYHGYISQSEINGSPGSPRWGRWRVRIPVDQFHVFVSAAKKLGVPERNTTDSQDVTAQYVDLDARLKNKKEQEETLRGYLKDTKARDQLKDILAVEQELGRVRGEVEQLEGELRLLSNLTSLTTVTLSVKEIKNYVPPEAPSFATNATRTLTGSTDAFIAVARACALAVIAAVPWIPAGVLVMALLWIMIRVARNALAGRPTTSPPPA
jgi:hypothetical protein